MFKVAFRNQTTYFIFRKFMIHNEIQEDVD